MPRRVLLTRSESAADPVAAALRGAGCEITFLPTHEYRDVPLEELEASLARLDTFQLVLPTSPRAVQRWWEVLGARGLDPRVADPPVAVIGPGSAERLRSLGREPLFVAEKAHSEGMAEELRARLTPGSAVLHAAAREVRPVLGESLRALGFRYEHLPLYDSVPRPAARQELEGLAAGLDAVVVTAGSSLHALLGGQRELPPGTYVALGPVTAAAFGAAGCAQPLVAATPDAPGILEALGWQP